MEAIDKDAAGRQRNKHGNWNCLGWMHCLGRFGSCFAKSIAQLRVELECFGHTQLTKACVLTLAITTWAGLNDTRVDTPVEGDAAKEPLEHGNMGLLNSEPCGSTTKIDATEFQGTRTMMPWQGTTAQDRSVLVG